jgi:enediyne biosynthesis protein E4
LQTFANGILISLPLLLISCNSGVNETECLGDGEWDGSSPAFVDASSSWGLSEISATGTRLSAVDFDGDGWTDLAVRKDNVPDENDADGRQVWLLRNNQEGGFEDVTYESGVLEARSSNEARPGSVWAFADVDNDNDLDIFVGLPDSSNQFSETSEILLNRGDGTFELASDDSDLRVSSNDMPYGASFSDVDLDGNIDLWVGQYSDASGPRQDRLYMGIGDGTFTNETKDFGLKTASWVNIDDLNNAVAHSNAWSVNSCDLNGDGYPELLAASYGRAPNHLWQNLGGNEFSNVSLSSGYAFDERVDWTDNESARCWCKLHPTDTDCDGVPAPSAIACSSDSDAFRWNHAYDREPFRLGGNSGETVCADLNNDGRLDLFTTEIVHWDVGESSDPSEILWNDHGESPIFFRPGGTATGITREHEISDWNEGDITASVFDFDNDGWPDIYLGSTDYTGTRGLLYRQISPEQFELVPTDVGVDHRRSHGSAVADFDRDGDLDLVVGHSPGRCGGECYDTFNIRLFENQLSGSGNWLQIALEGDESNRAAIGAQVTVELDGSTQLQEVDGGHGQWGNQDDLTLHFGMGQSCESEVTVRWPNENLTTQSFVLQAGHRYLIIEGQEPLKVENH